MEISIMFLLFFFEPFPKSIFLQIENIRSVSGQKRVVIHNYGHGGSGVTLSWGCAGQVVEILQTYINS